MSRFFSVGVYRKLRKYGAGSLFIQRVSQGIRFLSACAKGEGNSLRNANLAGSRVVRPVLVTVDVGLVLG